jgi:hypothetical protein
LLGGATKKVSVESRLKLILVHSDPCVSKLVTILTSKTCCLHDPADNGQIKQLLQGGGSDIIPHAPGRGVPKFACKNEIRRTVELNEFVELVGGEVAKVDLGTSGAGLLGVVLSFG